jgi:hypothetical protein
VKNNGILKLTGFVDSSGIGYEGGKVTINVLNLKTVTIVYTLTGLEKPQRIILAIP